MPALPARALAAPPHCVFIGGARAEKGYALLPALVGALHGQARFTVHSGPVGAAADPVVQRAHRALQRFAGADLRLIEQPLPPDAYQDLLPRRGRSACPPSCPPAVGWKPPSGRAPT